MLQKTRKISKLPIKINNLEYFNTMLYREVVAWYRIKIMASAQPVPCTIP